ncbi:MAG: hypothetical protein GEV28_18090 [Actinophytocola sp.]|uniref:hypothetical protein n=1 Tax=Actinophytocola sp. TaxID=1872138 RepID=UPI00132672F9|nr:hypothetical protein [Actinophytocola sp.]MPZ82201.1 hypothetical protein [Actinophytocola sp.]
MTSTQARALRPVGDDGRATVRVSGDPDAIRTLTALFDQRGIPDTYVRDGELLVVEPVSGTAPAAGDDNAPLPLAATVCTPPRLAALLAEHVNVIESRAAGKDGHTEVPVTPSRTVLSAVLSHRHWPGLPALRGLISAPVLRPDGTLLQDPGYDPATGYYLTTRMRMDRVPDQPTPDQVDTACTFLLDTFLADFPWRGDADRANYLALLVTPLLRPYTRALVPFGIVDATMPGSGKTILTSCIGLLVGQRVLTWPDADDELRKAITTVLADQVGAVVFDNLIEGHVINSAVLARLITERTWTDRRLGSNTAATFTNDRIWLATGNNLRVGGDMASRSVWVRLDPDCPQPEARSGFSIPNLDTWILDPDNQALVLHHLLVLVVDWCRHGAPTSTAVPQMRQFTRWAQHLGGFLTHHGIGDFLANHTDAAALDEDAAEWAHFLHTWHHIFADRPITARDLRASADPEPGRPDPWAGTFPTTPSGRPLTVKSLGRLLTGQTGRWRGDIVLRSATDTHANARSYWVQLDDPATPTRKPANPQNPP